MPAPFGGMPAERNTGRGAAGHLGIQLEYWRKAIPELVQPRTEARLRRYADEHYAGRYTRVDIRFRSQFCYIDAYTEPALPGPKWPPAIWPEATQE